MCLFYPKAVVKLIILVLNIPANFIISLSNANVFTNILFKATFYIFNSILGHSE